MGEGYTVSSAEQGRVPQRGQIPYLGPGATGLPQIRVIVQAILTPRPTGPRPGGDV